MPEAKRDLSIGEALDLGVEYAMAGDHLSAIGLFRGVLIHEPENFEAMNRLGAALFEIKKTHEALYWFWRAKKINRRHPLALCNYGMCLGQLGHREESLVELELARVHAEKTAGTSPETMAMIHNNLGNTLEGLGRYAEALAALNKGLAINPRDQFATYNRGIALLRLNRHTEGIDALDRAIALKPDDHDARYNRSMALLLLGRLREGFSDYEARLLTTENERPNFGLPASHKWNGEDLTGKTLLIHGEQGLGDHIQFLRFIPPLVERAGKVEFVCHTHTEELAKAVPGLHVLPQRSVLHVRGDEDSGYDYWVALMSLPRILGIEREDQIPPPWLPPINELKLRAWKATINELPRTGLLKVGFVWAGNFLHKNDARRSMSLKAFSKLFTVPGVDFVSLQIMRNEDREEFKALKEKHPNVHAIYVKGLDDTAAAIQALDLVISVDTMVAHLAASQNKPTWVFVPKFATDWRWQLDRSDTPWYPSMTLFRQGKIGDWTRALATAHRYLSELARGPLAIRQMPVGRVA